MVKSQSNQKSRPTRHSSPSSHFTPPGNQGEDVYNASAASKLCSTPSTNNHRPLLCSALVAMQQGVKAARYELLPLSQLAITSPHPAPCAAPDSPLMLNQVQADIYQEKEPLNKQFLVQDKSLNILTLSISPSSVSVMQLQSDNTKFGGRRNLCSSSDDVHGWQKYGEKFAEGNGVPRNHHKFAHPSCQVKMKCFSDGRVSDNIYMGVHDHQKHHPGHQQTNSVIYHVQEEERTKLPFRRDENDTCQVSCVNDCNVTIGHSAIPERIDDVDVVVETRDITCNNVLNEDDTTLKRRREEADGLDDSTVGKALREPRVVVQTLSDIDILDDGYRWRKYGQKVVKGNPNPRSYYKCTNVGCCVRKHVERASHDPKAVITTYEGKHNHDVPTLRSTSNDMAALVAISNNSHIRQTCFNPPSIHNMRRSLAGQYHESGSGEIICLDLGVGLSPRSYSRDGEMVQAPLTRQIANFQS